MQNSHFGDIRNLLEAFANILNVNTQRQYSTMNTEHATLPGESAETTVLCRIIDPVRKSLFLSAASHAQSICSSDFTDHL